MDSEPNNIQQVELDTELESLSPSILCFLGGPGAGKGTQAELLVRNFGFHHISTGQLLRDECSLTHSPHKEFIKACISRGDVVPYDFIMSLIKRRMTDIMGNYQPGIISKFILDGFPRDLDQAMSFDKEFGVPSCVIYLQCSSETMQARCLKRGSQVGRDDDKKEIIEKRIAAFAMVGKEALTHYRNLGVVSQIDGEKERFQVFEEVCGHLKANKILAL